MSRKTLIACFNSMNVHDNFMYNIIQAKRMSEEKLRMDAYYYSFEETGCIEVDRVLSAVACAGKAYHHTEDWNNFYHGVTSQVDHIQIAANKASERIKELELAIISALSISSIWLPDDGEFFSEDFEEEGKALASMHSNFKNLINQK